MCYAPDEILTSTYYNTTVILMKKFVVVPIELQKLLLPDENQIFVSSVCSVTRDQRYTVSYI